MDVNISNGKPDDKLLTSSDKELDEITDFIESRPLAIERWMQERASAPMIEKLKQLILRNSDNNPIRSSNNSNIYQSYIDISPCKQDRRPSILHLEENRKYLQTLEEGELFMELVRDVSNELDINVLCHKILVNVNLLTQADRGSLFLVKGPPSKRYLVAKLFDVTQDTSLEDALRRTKEDELTIPFGVGIAGIVAETKAIINLKDAYSDSRFNNAIDLRTGYRTNSILSLPILNYEGDVIGVAQIINKITGNGEFTVSDVDIFKRYLTFCGIGIQNAQLFELNLIEFKRNQILLNLARSIFEQQNNLERLVTKIMAEARDLLKCERCAVYLLELACCEANHLEEILEMSYSSKEEKNEPFVEKKEGSLSTKFTTIFELGYSLGSDIKVLHPSMNDLNSSTLAQIAEYVASTGEVVNTSDLRNWLDDKPYQGPHDDIDGIKTILCMPIWNGKRNVIGVAQLINKENDSHFRECDVSIFEAFAIFCGLGIHNTQMYESACKLMAKQKVALELLSYHASASDDQTLKLTNDDVPSAGEYKLYNFDFIDFNLTDDDTCKAVVRMFLDCNLLHIFKIPYEVLCRWILSVRKNYRPVKYHNWRHALNVAQTMFAMMKTGKMDRFMTDLEILGLLVACLCHDLDHRGTNNAFQTKTESPLAILYSTSTMEHHHFDQCVMILNSEGNNIFQALSPGDFKRVMKVVESAILSTDLAIFFQKREGFMNLIENGEFDFQGDEKKDLLCGMMITACDVSAIAKPWEVQHKIAKLVADEFFDQGDLEKLQLNTQPVAMMDRERKDELPKMQVCFIEVICLPLYKTLSETFPWMKPLYDGTFENKMHWEDLAEKVEMGLTWIDHDTIEKPVEEFNEIAEQLQDIEFTVTTLNSHSNISSADTTAVNKRTRFGSLKKSSGLSKAVRQKLSKTLHGSTSLHALEKEAETDAGSSSYAATTESVPEDNSLAKPKPQKKLSKLCLLL